MLRRLLVFSSVAFAVVYGLAESAPVDMATVEAQGDSSFSDAPVRVDGQTLFRVRGAPTFSAEKRAAEISKRISRFAADPALSTDSIKIIPQSEYAVIMGGDQFLLRVFDVDSAVPGLSHSGYAEMVKNILAKAVVDFRRSRTGSALLKDAALSVAGVVFLALLLWGWFWSYHRLRSLLERRLKPQISKIQTKSFHLIKAGLVWEGLNGVLSVLHGGMVGLIIYVHLGYVLHQFPWTRPLAEDLLALVLNPLRTIGLSFVSSLPGLVAVFVIGLLCFGALRTLRLLFAGIQSGTIAIAGFDQEWAVPTFRIVRVAVIALAVMIAYPHIPGSNSAAFKGVSVFLGIVISLGSSSFAANLIAGYSAIYRRAFRVGDIIEVDHFLGEVLEIQTLVTRLRTVKNELVVIPNSTIINSPVINYSAHAKDRGLILHTTVGIGYETPWRQVEAMLLEAAARTPGLLTDPKPFVLQKSLGDFCVTYELNVYCSTPALRQALTHALHQNILDLFNENNVQIMTPAYEGDPAQPKVVPKEKWFTPLRPPR